MRNIGTLIFDLDGTISDPSLGIYRCLNHSLRFHGFPEVSADIVNAEIGPPLDETFIKLCPELEQKTVASLVSKYRERYAEVGYAENRLYDGVSESLQELADRGVRMGICTSKRKDFAERILSLFGMISYFDFVDGGDIGIKKREQLFRLLQSGTIDQTAIMIGDREIDILAAKDNGLRCIGVLWGFGDIQELTAAGADVILYQPKDLAQLGV